jgi:hypothetical protein
MREKMAKAAIPDWRSYISSIRRSPSAPPLHTLSNWTRSPGVEPENLVSGRRDQADLADLAGAEYKPTTCTYYLKNMAALDGGASSVATPQSPLPLHSALHSASLWGKIEEVKALLEDPDVNIGGTSRSGNTVRQVSPRLNLTAATFHHHLTTKRHSMRPRRVRFLAWTTA